MQRRHIAYPILILLVFALLPRPVEASPGWLSGWDKRVKLTIDQNDVDSDLSDFPILIYLSASSGRGPSDVTFVFDELDAGGGQGSYPNRKRIAVTKSDGTSQLFVEIERWDDGASGNEKAWLWVKVSGINSISASTDTDLYLYYDADHADNTAYVGDTDSTPAENVWDSSFKGVWHLRETSGGTDAIKDSTSNNNDGTDSGSPTFGATGQIGNAIHFDGTDDCVMVPDDVSLHLGSGLTIEAWINIDIWGNWEDIVFKGGGNAGDSDYQFALVDTGLAWDGTYNGNWRTKYFTTTKDTGTWIYAVVSHDTVTVKCYRGGSEISSQADAGAIYESTYQLGISREGAATSGYVDGIIDEVRISNVPRNAAWIKAAHESGRDDLFDFGSEENPEVDTYQSDYSTLKDIYSIGETVYVKAISLEAGNYDFRYYSGWPGSPLEEWSELNVAESPSGEWRSSYALQGDDPTGTWGVRVFETGTSTLVCSCGFTVQAVPEFPYGAIMALVTGFAVFLAMRKTLKRKGEES